MFRYNRPGIFAGSAEPALAKQPIELFAPSAIPSVQQHQDAQAGNRAGRP